MQEEVNWARKLAWAAQSNKGKRTQKDFKQSSAQRGSLSQLTNHEKLQEEADMMMNNPEEGLPLLEAVRVEPYFSGSFCMQLQYSSLGGLKREHSRELVHKAISDAVCAGLVLPPNCHIEGEQTAR